MGISRSSLALGRILSADNPTGATIRERVDRGRLSRYRNGKRKPDADLIAWLDQVSGGEIAANGWGDSPAQGAPVVSQPVGFPAVRRGDGWVYFAVSGKWVKIGWTKNPDERFYQLIRVPPLTTDLVFRVLVGPCHKSYETAVLHTIGSKPSAGREFFEMTSQLATTIANLIAQAKDQFLPLPKQKRHLSAAGRSMVLLVAAESGADPRTVERFVFGEPTTQVASNAIQFAMRKLKTSPQAIREGKAKDNDHG